jgi:hypothetical protein
MHHFELVMISELERNPLTSTRHSTLILYMNESQLIQDGGVSAKDTKKGKGGEKKKKQSYQRYIKGNKGEKVEAHDSKRGMKFMPLIYPLTWICARTGSHLRACVLKNE